MVVDELAQHRHEDVDRMRGVAFLVREPAAAKRVIRAVHLRAAIDQEQRPGGPFDHDIIAVRCLCGMLPAGVRRWPSLACVS